SSSVGSTIAARKRERRSHAAGRTSTTVATGRLVPFQLVRTNEGEMGAEALDQIPFPLASFQKPFPSLCVSNVDGGFVVHEDERASRGGGSNTTCLCWASLARKSLVDPV